MKRMTPVIVVALIIGMVTGTAVHARSINDGIGRTSFSWLKAMPDAGISATGQCFAARDDFSALLVHPAAIAVGDTATLKMSYVAHYVDSQYGSVGYAGTIRGKRLGLRLTYVNYGEFEGRTEINEPTGSFSAGDLGITLNLGRQVRDDLRVGAMVTWITSSIDDYTAQAATVDIGAIYYPPFEGFTVGASLMNVGKVLKGYSDAGEETLPVYLAVGARKQLAHAPVTLYTDVTFPNDNDITYGYGITITVRDMLRISAGTRSRSELDREENTSTVDFAGNPTFGMDLDLKRCRFSYAFCPEDDLDDVHKVTLSMPFR